MTVNDWFLRVLIPVSQHRTATSLPCAPDERIIILAADADRIQSYVFESDRLAEIRGASRLLAEVNHDVINRLLFDTYQRTGLDDRAA